MTYRNDEPTLGLGYLGFEIRERDGWYVGVFMQAERSKVFEAQSRTVLEHKIRRWWVNAQ